jgi:hypothetical protein
MDFRREQTKGVQCSYEAEAKLAKVQGRRFDGKIRSTAEEPLKISELFQTE